MRTASQPFCCSTAMPLFGFPSFSAVAFPSRVANSSFSTAVSSATSLPLLPTSHCHPLTLSALGNDSDLRTLVSSPSSLNSNLIDLVIPTVPSPVGLIDSQGNGRGQEAPPACSYGCWPTPAPPRARFHIRPDRQWLGRCEGRLILHQVVRLWVCAEPMVRRKGRQDAVVTTSSVEVEGQLKGLKELGWEWGMVRRRCPGIVAAAHGPVTANGPERLGFWVNVVCRVLWSS